MYGFKRCRAAEDKKGMCVILSELDGLNDEELNSEANELPDKDGDACIDRENLRKNIDESEPSAAENKEKSEETENKAGTEDLLADASDYGEKGDSPLDEVLSGADNAERIENDENTSVSSDDALEDDTYPSEVVFVAKENEFLSAEIDAGLSDIVIPPKTDTAASDYFESFTDTDGGFGIYEQGEKPSGRKIDDRLARLERSIKDTQDRSERNKRGAVMSAIENMFSDSENQRKSRILGIPGNIFGVIIVVLFLADMLALNIASYKIIYVIVEKMLVSNGVEALRLSDKGFSEIFVGVSYVVSFFVGGLVVLLLSRFTERIIRELEFSGSAVLMNCIVGLFAFVFMIGTVVAAVVSQSFLSIAVYRWAGPLFSYAGGLLFLTISKISLSVDY